MSRETIVKVTLTRREYDLINRYVRDGYALSRSDAVRQAVILHLADVGRIRSYMDIDDGLLNEEYDKMINSTNDEKK